MSKGNHLGTNWTREEDTLIWNGAEILKLSNRQLVAALEVAGFTRTIDAVRDRLRRIQQSRDTGTPLRYFGEANNPVQHSLSDIERLAMHKSWTAPMPAKPKMILIYQVYDKDRPTTTDCFFETVEKAEKFRKTLTNPTEVIVHRMGTTKADILRALELYPQRGFSV